MKDIFKRLLISTICILFIVYLLYLFFTHQIIVQSYFEERNTLYYIVLFVVFLYIFIFFSLSPAYFKISKTSLFVIGISFIVIGDTVLLNNSNTYLFLGDIIKITGVLFTVLAFSNFFITSKVKKQKEDSKVEIIEI